MTKLTTLLPFLSEQIIFILQYADMSIRCESVLIALAELDETAENNNIRRSEKERETIRCLWCTLSKKKKKKKPTKL